MVGDEETEKETTKILEALTIKIDELTKAVKEKKIITEDKTKETSKEETKILEKLTNKIDELTKTIKEKKIITEDKIKENPLAYVIGAFTGGLVVGFLIGKGKEGKE
jgi:ElaB/YqjD/DUF883 family membrane-anchored ribosome-binding protein